MSASAGDIVFEAPDFFRYSRFGVVRFAAAARIGLVALITTAGFVDDVALVAAGLAGIVAVASVAVMTRYLDTV